MKKYGYVYLIRSGTSDRYKIGNATELEVRLHALQTGNEKLLTIRHSVYVANPRFVENLLHERFLRYRHALEWFTFDEFAIDSVIESMDRFSLCRVRGGDS